MTQALEDNYPWEQRGSHYNDGGRVYRPYKLMKEEDIGIRVKCDEHFAAWYMGTVLKNPKSEVSRRMKERLENDWVAGWYMDGGKESMFENAKVHGFVAGMRAYPFASPRTGEKEIKELAERL